LDFGFWILDLKFVSAKSLKASHESPENLFLSGTENVLAASDGFLPAAFGQRQTEIVKPLF